MLNDPKIVSAVSHILQRSEKQEDPQKILGTFVDIGILPQLGNQNNQIFYGRRGTGKTHVLRVLGSKLKETSSNLVIYIDSRTLGSTSQFCDTSIPISRRCLALFRDILIEIYNGLLEYIINNPTDKGDMALDEADHLKETIIMPSESIQGKSITSTISTKASDDNACGINIGGNGIHLNAISETHELDEKHTTSSYNVNHEDKVIFPDLNRSLEKTLELTECKLFILLDEWSSLPYDIQPYLAEFLKRGILPVQRATIKIASLEYRSNFSDVNKKPFLGFELGADISTATDLDEYYVFDRNPEHVTDLYSDMLLAHINSELQPNYLSQYHKVKNGRDLASRLFTERETFKELARASEGVVRDLINIFIAAFFHAKRGNRNSIDRRAILESARQWFETDKSQHLDDQLQSVLRKIVDEVIGKRRARSFLLPRNLEKHPVIQKLFDARVLHHLQRGYADKDNPGIRYNIYTLDYGTYVDLKGTSTEPTVDFLENKDGSDFIVPFDDKRSIRRIILREEILD